jgi:hypothetical protein
MTVSMARRLFLEVENVKNILGWMCIISAGSAGCGASLDPAWLLNSSILSTAPSK